MCAIMSMVLFLVVNLTSSNLKGGMFPVLISLFTFAISSSSSLNQFWEKQYTSELSPLLRSQDMCQNPHQNSEFQVLLFVANSDSPTQFLLQTVLRLTSY